MENLSNGKLPPRREVEATEFSLKDAEEFVFKSLAPELVPRLTKSIRQLAGRHENAAEAYVLCF
jgi:hypothetical protein